MSKYISKEDISRVLLERTGANKSCLSNARERRYDEGEQYFQKLVFEDEQITSLIDGLPSADVRPNIHARWIELPKAFNSNELPCKCSNPKCGEILSFMNGYPKSKFCPSCGAIMDGAPKGEKGTE